jgi:hypothetical protein
MDESQLLILFDAWQSLNAFVHLFFNANASSVLCCVRIKAKVDVGLIGELDAQFLKQSMLIGTWIVYLQY